MSADPNKKSARTFQCREVLWGTFEQMARDLECSVDYLINEAMKQYARQRSQDGARPAYSPSQPGPPATATAAAARPAHGGGMPPLPPPSRVPPPPGRPAVGVGSPGAASRGPLPPPPPLGRVPSSSPMAARGTPLPPRTVPPPLPRMPMTPGPNGFPAAGAHSAALTLVYLGERFPITKDRFVIGRGKQSSDLTLKDPNVSRQHAMIEFQNGVYFMVDMGSTNGIEYNGQRIARKQITEGDVFRICDHDLMFTFH
jgi:hypothetical protein